MRWDDQRIDRRLAPVPGRRRHPNLDGEGLECFALEAGFDDVRSKRPAQLNGSLLLLARRP